MNTKKLNFLPSEEIAARGKTSRPELYSRISAVSDLFETRKKAAEAAGISTDQLARYANGQSQPGLVPIAKMCDAAGVRLGWLWTGEGPMRTGGARPEPTAPAGIWEEFALVPLYDVSVSTGPGVLVESEAVLAQLAFRRDWLRQTGIQADNLAVVRAVGDSMEPTIRHGDALLVDRAKREPEGGYIYVLQIDHELRAKRLQRLADGRVRLGTDNFAYAEEFIERDRLHQLEIVGRVVWKGGMM
ncbi:LexA family transcriptional regulator [Thiocystis violascens]|uniref:Putative transcriptional regulator n=1 Tax=Thiocystis violascens (strain ATCC 17096 / DSM 198 / 6111) TaxID=765911 RepID=I3YEF2_THIV6|nr:helix-turn-helix transcriptional regulator [Thiocystis violascens]AFL75370.1 putative transcriptional regulator [Thiocystis violascens DSM 198]